MCVVWFGRSAVQELGEALYALIAPTEPLLAGKITGMLLEAPAYPPARLQARPTQPPIPRHARRHCLTRRID